MISIFRILFGLRIKFIEVLLEYLCYVDGVVVVVLFVRLFLSRGVSLIFILGIIVISFYIL